MILVKSLEEIQSRIQSRRTAVTIGVFDGLHRGHQALVERAVEAGTTYDVSSLLITFNQHPLAVLAPPYAPKKLVYPDRKALLLERLGIDICASIDFTQEFAQQMPESFVRDVLKGICHVRAIICGYDFTFGHKGSGNISLLRSLGTELGFDVIVVDAVSQQDVFIKSTAIRDLLFSGHVERAGELLGHPYELRGEVVRGFGRGKQIGFPTANLQIDEGYVIPARGVYVCLATIDNESEIHGAMVNVGFNPTFGLERLSIEAHLLNFEAELPGHTLNLFFIYRLRDEQKFDSVDALIGQLELDRTASQRLLASNGLITARDAVRNML